VAKGLRKFWIILHRYVGLAAAAFLVVAGLTGAILAFESDYKLWIHQLHWPVAPEAARLPEQELTDRLERQLTSTGAPVHVEQIQFAGDRAAQVFVLSTGRRVYMNPYNGTVLGTQDGPSATEKFFAAMLQLHVRLVAGNVGRWAVVTGTLTLLLLVPTGVYLWWDKKRISVNLKASWRRINWDLHSVIGVYGCVVMFALAGTGLLIEVQTPLYWITNARPQLESLPRSTPPSDATGNVHAPDLDGFILAADKAVPNLQTYQINLPQRPRSPVQVLKQTAGTRARTTVYLDRYDGHVLRVDDSHTRSRALQAHNVNLAIHTGTIMGLPGRIVVSLSSLMLVVSAITGFIIWWQKPGTPSRVVPPQG